jgi:predicted ATPase
MAQLDSITLKGFKSIRELNDFKLQKLNVLIGPNGAGKSNFVDFFRLLRAMAEEGLQGLIVQSGGADGFLFNGPKETKQISALLKFGWNQYRFTAEPNVAGELILREEGVLYTGGKRPNDWQIYYVPKKESSLKDWKGSKSSWGDYLSAEGYVHKSVSSWIVYHFHDTSSTAPMRRDQALRDFRELNPTAGNIAAFLKNIRENWSAKYQRIRETIQIIAPFFDDFLLEPQTKGDNELIRLEWRQKGSSFPFQPWQLSDGTIRFICLATALLQPVPPSTVVIDEPELGLHPYALEVLAALIHEASLHTQLVVSTQSPLLVDRFDAEHIITVQRKDGASSFDRLEPEPLADWLKDFSLGELVRKNVVETAPHE